MADIAAGSADRSALGQLDAEIARQREEIAKATKDVGPIIANAEQSIVGLERRLAAAEHELQTLDALKYDLLMKFVEQEAELVASTYKERAEQFWDAFKQMMGLSLLKHHLYVKRQQRLGKRAFGDYSLVFRPSEIRIGKFRLEAFGRPTDWYEGLLFNSDTLTGAEALAAAKQRLQEEGVNLE